MTESWHPDLADPDDPGAWEAEGMRLLDSVVAGFVLAAAVLWALRTLGVV